MQDQHVDRPGVYVRQRTQLTGPNRPIGSKSPITHSSHPHTLLRETGLKPNTHTPNHQNLPPGHRYWGVVARLPHQGTRRVCWTTWWLWRGACTRSLPELGREKPQRPWYCVSRHGRVGRRQVFQHTPNTQTPNIQQITHAGWSSPVARQAHNLKVIGSNPIPATNDNCDIIAP